jgi:LuxR family transcriptional regulator of csgAB operon
VLERCIEEDVSNTHIIERKSMNQASHNLTKREMEILALVTVGTKNDDIANKLCISTHTVKTHLYNLFKKIDVSDRLQAALWAAKNLQ